MKGAGARPSVGDRGRSEAAREGQPERREARRRARGRRGVARGAVARSRTRPGRRCARGRGTGRGRAGATTVRHASGETRGKVASGGVRTRRRSIRNSTHGGGKAKGRLTSQRVGGPGEPEGPCRRGPAAGRADRREGEVEVRVEGGRHAEEEEPRGRSRRGRRGRKGAARRRPGRRPSAPAGGGRPRARARRVEGNEQGRPSSVRQRVYVGDGAGRERGRVGVSVRFPPSGGIWRRVWAPAGPVG